MTTRTTISITDEQWEQIKEIQEETGAAVSEIIRRALTHYFTAPLVRSASAPLPSTRRRRIQYHGQSK